MESWLGAGTAPDAVDWRTIVCGVTHCSVTTGNAGGDLRTRTAVLERVSETGNSLTVRLLGPHLEDDVIPNPRIVITASVAIGPVGFLVVNGLARIHSHMAAASGDDVVLLDVAIQRIECWGASEATPERPASDAASSTVSPLPLPCHPAIAMAQ